MPSENLFPVLLHTVRSCARIIFRSHKILRFKKFPVERDYFQKVTDKTCSPPPLRVGKAVNNSRVKDKGIVDFIGGLALFTRCPHARFGEQRVHINSLSVGRFEL
jgi:hypothetical protein